MANGHRDSVIDSLELLFDAATVTGLSEAQLLERFLAHRDESAFEAKTIAPKLGDSEITAAREQIGSFMGLTDVPDKFLTENPYGEAFSLARREQLGLDPAKLNRALDVLTDGDLRRAAAEFFAPSRHAGVVISIKK